MPNSLYKYLSIILFFIPIIGGLAQPARLSFIVKKDSANVYQKMLNDQSDDLMENHPAEDIYNNIWTREKINPYKIPVDSLPDSVLIDCSHFVIPTYNVVTSDFGPRRYRYHYGTDLRVKVGDSIVSAFSGKVRIIDFEARGYGNYIVIRHDNGLETVYAHLSQVLVVHNQTVKAGELIGLGGNTGHSTGPHLHFETRYIGNAINPANIIDFNTGLVCAPTYLITKKKSFFYQQDAKRLLAMKTAIKYYIARKGDNLRKVAVRNGLSLRSLCKLNGLKTSSHIKKGLQLRVR
jgi:Peptidase family M23/LysM domain